MVRSNTKEIVLVAFLFVIGCSAPQNTKTSGSKKDPSTSPDVGTTPPPIVAGTYYISPTGNDLNTCNQAQNFSTPKQTLSSAKTCLSAGAKLVFLDGTYSGNLNAFTNLPSGLSAGFITFAALNEGKVIITSGIDLSHTNSYLIVQGLRFQNAATKTILGNHIKFFRNEFNGGCAFGNCTGVTVGTNDYNDTADILFEDNWFHGLGGRYNLLVYNANRVVIRRAIVRHDGGWTDDKSDPAAGINFYNSTNCSVQNSIVLDSIILASEQTHNTWQSAFYNVFNNASPNSNNSNSWYGIIALNNPVSTDGAGLRFDGNAAQTGHFVQNAVLWDNYWGLNVSWASPISLSTTNLTIGRTNNLSSPGYGVGGGSGGTKTFSNFIITNMSNSDFSVSGGILSFFNTFNNGSSTNSTGKVTYNPTTNGLLYLPRIESGMALKTAGQSGGQLGAQILTRIGYSETMQGDPNWNVDSQQSLWPFPNQERIKKEMCADVNVTRGFCAKPSLSHYIWEYLGNTCPVGMCN